ncbi:tRNA (adenosine(37)-N6)-threonylcarbamoyltransferase complex ATPase subunit type 1 TsaE [Peptococcus simiae]|uniref:tRNA (adenosine(37)-N6)-threonylcarbamoyltransferase complex ATPase subunit type 1 TsaE n=1 Tax=Peptococcus simiae TaxID=1643805 RepID=UPI003980218C
MYLADSEATRQAGQALAAVLRAGDLILLQGDLGAGKTTWTQGLAEGLGVLEPVTSPTFVIISEYDSGRLPLYHIDAYRLETPMEAELLGIPELIEGEGVTVIEWPERLEGYLPQDALVISLTYEGEARTLSAVDRGHSDILKRGGQSCIS